MRIPRGKWILQLLAVLMSFGGSPASWAQVFSHVESAPAAEHCQSDDSGTSHDGKGMSCCDKGACGCASSVAMSSTAVRLTGHSAPPAADFILLPDRAEPVGQLLRPPRS